jgi:MFS family permease
MPDAYAALRIPDYRRFLGARLMVTLAVQIMSVSVGYYVYELTNSKLMLGLLGLTAALPAIGVSLYAGHLADKRNRRNLLIACLVLFSICAAILLSIGIFRESLSKHFILTGIYTALFLNGIGRGFFSPTNFAFLPQLVDKEHLSNAISWNSSTWEVASVTGLGLGGVIYGVWGITITFSIMLALILIGIVLLVQIRSRPVPPTATMESATKRIREGLKFVFNNQLIIASIALDLFAVLFGGAVALLPVFAKDILQVGPEGFGALRMAMSLGAIVMALFLAHRPLGSGAGRLLLFCVAGFGVCIIVFGLSKFFWVSFVCLIVAGMLDEISVFVRSSLVQRLTPDNMKGRVSSVNSIFITSSNEIGEFESGLSAEYLGPVTATVIGGSLTLLVVAITWWKAPKLRELDFNQLDESSAQ